jgi:hypothetical protein
MRSDTPRGSAATRRRAALIGGLVVAILVATGAVSAAAGTGRAVTPTATEIGVTATEIRITVIADVDNPIVPALFQGAVDGVKGAAAYLNSKAGGGGIAGRKLVVDFIDSKLNANAARNATITACGTSLALVGTSATGLSSTADIAACKDEAGAATGLPDIPAVSGAIEGCSPVAYPINPGATVCGTGTQTPQTYQTNQAAFTYLRKQHKDLHGAYLYTNDSKTGVVTGQSLIHASTGAGITSDSTMAVSALSPQSAYTPAIQAMKQHGSNYNYTIGSVNGMVAVRSEARLQGLTDPNIVWVCTTACYNKTLHQQADVMNGTYVPMAFLPFEEAKSNATLANFIKYVGPTKVDAFAAYAWVATLAFAQGARAAVAKNGINGLTRRSLLQGMQTLTAFNAGGMFGTVDIAHHKVTPCQLVTQFKNNKFVRIWPSKVGTLDCKPSNVSVYKADFIGG